MSCTRTFRTSLSALALAAALVAPAFAAAYNPVSYTHLDVYKRQALPFACGEREGATRWVRGSRRYT